MYQTNENPKLLKKYLFVTKSFRKGGTNPKILEKPPLTTLTTVENPKEISLLSAKSSPMPSYFNYSILMGIYKDLSSKERGNVKVLD